MKNLFILVLIALLPIVGSACSCVLGPGFIDWAQSQEFDDFNGIVWIGEYVQTQVIDVNLTATQYSVREVLCGEIKTEYEITPSPFTPNTNYLDDFPNSESTIWVFGGSEATCLEVHGTADHLFATTWSTFEPAYGYQTHLCNFDFYPINSDDEVNGNLTGDEATEIMTLDEIRGVLSCTDTGSGINSLEIPVIRSYPNPVSDFLRFQNPTISGKELLQIFSADGNLVLSQERFDANSPLNISELTQGRYYTQFSVGRKVTASSSFVKL